MLKVVGWEVLTVVVMKGYSSTPCDPLIVNRHTSFATGVPERLFRQKDYSD
jgi:hypothetical protein